MSTPDRPQSKLSSGDRGFIRVNAIELAELPEPGTEFLSGDWPDYLRDRQHKMVSHNVIQKVEMDIVGRDYRAVWTTNSVAWEHIQHYAQIRKEKDGYLPCGHDGFVTIGDDEYRCKRDNCKQVWTREQINLHND